MAVTYLRELNGQHIRKKSILKILSPNALIKLTSYLAGWQSHRHRVWPKTWRQKYHCREKKIRHPCKFFSVKYVATLKPILVVNVFIPLTFFRLRPGEKTGCSLRLPSKGRPWFCSLSVRPIKPSESFCRWYHCHCFFLAIILTIAENYLFHIRGSFVFCNWSSANSTATLSRIATDGPGVILNFKFLFGFAMFLRLCLMLLVNKLRQVAHLENEMICLNGLHAEKWNENTTKNNTTV